MALRAFRLVTILFLLSFQFNASAMSLGTAFAVSKDGWLLTNHHVIEGGKTVIVKNSKGELSPATVVSFDADSDIALLKIQGPLIDWLLLASPDLAKKGEKVVTVGYPHVDIQGSESKVTDGILNSLSGIRGDNCCFQISVPIQSGNSGGPLVRLDGTVIGIVSAKLKAEKIFRETGDLTQNVNYAIKISEAKKLFSNSGKITFANKSGKTNKDIEQLTEIVDKAVYLVSSVRLTNEMPSQE